MGGPLADREWRLISEESRPAAMQMALDEVAAGTAAAGGPRTARVYRWPAPGALSLGYGQAPDTVDWAFCERAGVEVTRRPTGGGGIYHDHAGDVSYALAVPAADLPDGPRASYRLLCEPLLAALDALGIDAGYAETGRPAVHPPACYLRALDPAHDVVGPDGRKVSGNAQRRTREAVVQHGSLTHDARPERHLAAFAADLDPSDFRERVAGVTAYADATRAETVGALESALADWTGADPGGRGWTDAELDRARALVRERFGDEAWVRRGPRG
ncbi:MAG: biotin/lipoate A/B protein ligase family protein [Haloferacaceae archaeon]